MKAKPGAYEERCLQENCARGEVEWVDRLTSGRSTNIHSRVRRVLEIVVVGELGVGYKKVDKTPIVVRDDGGGNELSADVSSCTSVPLRINYAIAMTGRPRALSPRGARRPRVAQLLQPYAYWLSSQGKEDHSSGMMRITMGIAMRCVRLHTWRIW